MSSRDTDDLTVIRCFRCAGTGDSSQTRKCVTCDGTGSVFWIDGRAIPYTPEGEKRARPKQPSEGSK